MVYCMSSLEEQCEESTRLFGKPYIEIHLWLDEFDGSPECGMRHRRKRHHLAGIEVARKIFGDDVVKAARQHIVTDLRTEDCHEFRVSGTPYLIIFPCSFVLVELVMMSPELPPLNYHRQKNRHRRRLNHLYKPLTIVWHVSCAKI